MAASPQATKGNSVKYMPGSGPGVARTCPHSGGAFTMGGPYWADAIHDRSAVAAVLADVEVEASRGMTVSCAPGD